MSPEDFRLVNVAAAFLIAVTLTSRAWTSWSTWPQARRWDFAARAAAQISIFCGTIYASTIAWLDPAAPMRGYVYVVTACLVGYLLTLWTPWRWRR